MLRFRFSRLNAGPNLSSIARGFASRKNRNTSEPASAGGGGSASNAADGNNGDASTATTSSSKPPATSEDFEHFLASRSPLTNTVPDVWPHVPLIATDNTLIFPRFTKTIQLTDPLHLHAIRRQIAVQQPYVGVFLKQRERQQPDEEPIEHVHQIHATGTFGHLLEAHDYGGRMSVTVRAVRRILARSVQTTTTTTTATCPQVTVDNVSHVPFERTASVKALTQEIVRTIRHMADERPLPAELLRQLQREEQYVFQDTVYLCDLGAVVCARGATRTELQEVLGERRMPERLHAALALLKREVERERLQQRIGDEVDENVRQMHRKFMLTERVKVIKKELGLDRTDDRQAVADRMQARLGGRDGVPAEVRRVFDAEVQRMRQMPDGSAEFNIAHTYLDWLTAMPWGRRTAETMDLERAARVLDRDHYGMADVKQRILELIAVGQLRGGTHQTTAGRIVCLHGPPGIGKSSIAGSIAAALNRRYFRFSVGGMHSAAEVKGHRRTYVGAQPGKLVQCLKQTGAENPLVLIDEIDKLSGAGSPGAAGGGVGHAVVGGDPAAALLELLDPEQNDAFVDFYLDVPVDLSRVLFVCTANYAENIAPVLADRMELIEMPGYVDAEKCAIAERYLVPRVLRACGMSDKMVRIERAALELMMQAYSAESGVRRLQQLIEQVVRKVAFQVVSGAGPDKRAARSTVVVTADNLPLYLGQATKSAERFIGERGRATPVGVVMGLGLTHHGGTVIYVETAATPVRLAATRLPLQVTGNVGAVMRESADIALTVARNALAADDAGGAASFFDAHRIHVHVPKGAQPKDGPSAGVTIVAALQSLATGRPIRGDLAMTGELSLNGKILAVGGVREKMMAARRLGVRECVLPADNRWDFEALPEEVRAGMQVHYVQEYADVMGIVFV